MASKSGEQIIKMILQLIRYDIPVLMVGESSIGKSVTIDWMGNRYRIPNQFLYIGSEKPENIEGLPKLTGLTEASQRLDYLKPFWFPYSEVVTSMVKKGKSIFDGYIANYYNDKAGFNYQYQTLAPLLEAFADIKWEMDATKVEVKLYDIDDTKRQFNDKPFELNRMNIPNVNGKYHDDDVRDVCLYLCTVLGYGNYWLVLDEIDKVDEMDTDKYAPLLHIVRERRLKDNSLQQINNDKGISILSSVKGSDYKPIVDIIESSIKNNKSLLDTRVISIGNKTGNIEEALFRRFVQVIITEELIFKKIDPSLLELKKCLDAIETKEFDPSMLDIGKIDKVNLQWSLNFFPKMTNRNDLAGNFFVSDFFAALQSIKVDKEDTTNYNIAVKIAGTTTALWKVIVDNFEDSERCEKIFDCLTTMILTSGEKVKGNSIQDKREAVTEYLLQGLTDDEIHNEIIAELSKAYPADITGADTMATGGTVDPVTQQTTKLIAVQKWAIENCYGWIVATLFDDKQDLLQMEVNKMLIPSIQKLIIEKMSIDLFEDKLNPDNYGAVQDEVGNWWQAFKQKYQLDKIMASPEKTQIALSGATFEAIKTMSKEEKIRVSKNSLYGADRTLECFRESLSFKVGCSPQSIQQGLEYFVKNDFVFPEGVLEFWLANEYIYRKYVFALIKEYKDQVASGKISSVDGKTAENKIRKAFKGYQGI